MRKFPPDNPDLPELDGKRTKEAVEAALEKYRIFMTTDVEEREASTTSSLSNTPRGNTGTTSDQTGDIATYNIDIKKQRQDYCRRVDRVVNRLHPMEKLLIEERYMKSPYVFDYQVYTFKFKPPISPGKYKKLRRNAIYQIALALDIAVEKVSRNPVDE